MTTMSNSFNPTFIMVLLLVLLTFATFPTTIFGFVATTCNCPNQQKILLLSKFSANRCCHNGGIITSSSCNSKIGILLQSMKNYNDSNNNRTDNDDKFIKDNDKNNYNDNNDDIIQYSDFWGTKTIYNTNNNNNKLPCNPLMDPLDGPLPQGAYYFPSSSSSSSTTSSSSWMENVEPKPVCRVGVAINLWNIQHPNEIVRHMQQLLDAGFTTFHLRPPKNNNNGSMLSFGEQEIYGRFIKNTPGTVVQHSHLIVPLSIGYSNNNGSDNSGNSNQELYDSSLTINKKTIRNAVLEKLLRTGGDCIDTLQLPYCKGSPYHLDVLDYLTDLQRDGYIRSIATRNMPLSLLVRARNYGFHNINANQIDGNILSQPPDFNNMKYTSAPTIWLSSPLAGGWLTDRFTSASYKKRNMNNNNNNNNVIVPEMWDLSYMERMHFHSTLQDWARRYQGPKEYHNQELWDLYQQELLDSLSYIALKHGVSIASVALRWALQYNNNNNNEQDHPQSNIKTVFAACDLSDLSETTGRVFDRPKRLREVFRFELDQDDMEELAALSPPIQKGNTNNQYIIDNEQQQESEFPTGMLTRDEQEQWEELSEELRLELLEEKQEQQRHKKQGEKEYPAIDFGNRSLWL